MILNSLSWLGRIRRPCLLCHAWSDTPICLACVGDLPWTDPQTPVDTLTPGPGLALPVYAAFHYRYPIDRAIAAFKRGGSDCCLDRLLTLALLRSNRQLWAPVDQLLPLPASPRRSRRRFDLTARLASGLSERQLAVGRVVWVAGETQRGRDAQSRRAAERRFRVQSLALGRRVGLVDDVCTTGASLSALARACHDQGLQSAWAWVLAYTPPPRDRTLRHRG